MSADLTSTKIQPCTTLKSENQDIVGKNWSIEIWTIVAGGSNDGTTKAITSGLTTPLFVTVSQPVSDENTRTFCAISGQTVTVGWSTAPTTQTYYVKIEGWA